MYKTVNNPLNLSHEELEEFAAAFRTNAYEIITTIPVDGNEAEMHPFYMNKASYQKIFNDEDAYFHYFSIRYKTTKNEYVVIPIGTYGISDTKKVRFPLVIEKFWYLLLAVNKEQFCSVGNIIKEADHNFYYSKCIDVRNQFIHNVFKYYFLLDSGYCSAMGWQIRKSSNSHTKRISQSLGFHIFESNGDEIHCSTQDQWEYLSDCYLRWGILFPKGSENAPIDGISDKDPNKLKLFVRGMVNYDIKEGSYL